MNLLKIYEHSTNIEHLKEIERIKKIEHDIYNSKLLSNCITKILFNFILRFSHFGYSCIGSLAIGRKIFPRSRT